MIDPGDPVFWWLFRATLAVALAVALWAFADGIVIRRR